MAVKIKLKRLGKMRNPQYRIVVADARTKRDGRAIEEIGTYQPKQDPSLIIVDSERARYWLSVGAQPTEAVTAILKVTGDWQAAKGLPGSEGTLQTVAPRADKKAVFEAAAKESADEPRAEAVTPRARKAAPAPAADPVVEAEAAPEPAAEPVEEPVAEADGRARRRGRVAPSRSPSPSPSSTDEPTADAEAVPAAEAAEAEESGESA